MRGEATRRRERPIINLMNDYHYQLLRKRIIRVTKVCVDFRRYYVLSF
jgi:hypothetical protein